MPVRSTSTWKLSNCSLRVVSGTGVVSVEGDTITANRAGTAKLSVVDLAGKSIGAVSVTVTKLDGSWKLQSAATGASGAKRYLRISGASQSNRANVCVYKNSGASTVFVLSKQPGGTIGLKNKGSKKYVRVSGTKANKANVFQYKARNVKAQRWTMRVDAANRITFVNAKTGKALTVAKAKPKMGTNVYQYTDKDKLTQKWYLVPAKR
jgi:hypothetical protein